MNGSIDIKVKPEEAFDLLAIQNLVEHAVGQPVTEVRIEKRSLDARHGKVSYQLRVQYALAGLLPATLPHEPVFQHVDRAEEIWIIGAGPAGYFCALELIAQGHKPVIVERGKPVRERRRDLAQLTKQGVVNPHSNYCFGEGGAGTYSDGKLYSRSDKRGDLVRVYRDFVFFGADPDILVNARPHIGTNKLPDVISKMRHFIESAGGNVLFDTHLTDVEVAGGQIKKIQVNGAEWHKVSALVLATGHSARDVYELLHQRKVLLEAKPFALGVRVEHPQRLIDEIQYRRKERGPHLPPASYSLVTQVSGRGVYSFCMCPGGIIAPCATAPGELVTNGWSPSKRNNPWANSGMVVALELSDFVQKGIPPDPLMGLRFQASIEQKVFGLVQQGQKAPALRLTDVVKRRLSNTLPDCSYHPGIVSAPLWEALPGFIFQRLQAGLLQFGKQMPGYMTEEAVAVATESRTSSPVRIPRRPDTLAHPELDNFFPCGEGAGYAGGIASAAIDGIKCARAAVAKIKA